MKNLIYIAAFIFTSPLAGAADFDCLAQVKNHLISNRPVQETIAQAMKLTKVQADDLKPGAEFFMSESVDPSRPDRTKLTYDYLAVTPGFRLRQVFEFRASEAMSENIFEVELSADVFTAEGLPVRSETTVYAMKSNCASKKISEFVQNYKVLPGRRMQIERTSLQLIKAPVSAKRIISLADAHSIGGINLAQSTDDFRSMNIYNGAEFSFVLKDDELSVIKTKLRDSPVLRRHNPFSNKIESLKGAELRAEELNFTLQYYQADDGLYFAEKLDFNGSVSYKDSTTREKWLNLKLATAKKNQPTMFGFEKPDFKAPELRYQIFGTGKIQLFNPSSYFEVEKFEQGGSIFEAVLKVTALPLPTAVPWNARVLPEDKKYLAGSKWIQLDVGGKIAATLRPRLKGMNRLQAAEAITAEIAKRITYDQDALKDNLVDKRSATDILRTGKGVCQHFSVLFVSVARSLGIPARIISGWSLEPEKPIGHSWVEVKVNDSVWWPLDAQHVGQRLLTRDFVPVTEDRGYEAEAEDPNISLSIISADFPKWEAYISATFAKKP